MGEGAFGCGAMGAMTTGKLKFSGPKMETMGVMGPFNLETAVDRLISHASHWAGKHLALYANSPTG